MPYLEGRVPSGAAGRLEKHLGDCASCRTAFARVRDGHRFALRLSLPGAPGTPEAPAFESLKPGDRDAGRGRWARTWARWFDARATPRLVHVIAALFVAQLTILAVLNRGVFFKESGSASLTPVAMDLDRFRPLSILEFHTNTAPHVTTEGYVRDVRLDAEEKTLHFNLVQIPQGSGPFVVCEILSPGEIAVPREGSRVRVYGVARYDAQTGREYHEVNPVLNIAVLNR
ncbi:MAG: anti-sigma factor [Candidatus Aminicenantales bacterium]